MRITNYSCERITNKLLCGVVEERSLAMILNSQDAKRASCPKKPRKGKYDPKKLADLELFSASSILWL